MIKTNIVSFSKDQLRSALLATNQELLASIAPMLWEADVDGSVLLDLNKEDFKDLGLSFGQARKIKLWLDKMKGTKELKKVTVKLEDSQARNSPCKEELLKGAPSEADLFELQLDEFQENIKKSKEQLDETKQLGKKIPEEERIPFICVEKPKKKESKVQASVKQLLSTPIQRRRNRRPVAKATVIIKQENDTNSSEKPCPIFQRKKPVDLDLVNVTFEKRPLGFQLKISKEEPPHFEVAQIFSQEIKSQGLRVGMLATTFEDLKLKHLGEAGTRELFRESILPITVTFESLEKLRAGKSLELDDLGVNPTPYEASMSLRLCGHLPPSPAQKIRNPSARVNSAPEHSEGVRRKRKRPGKLPTLRPRKSKLITKSSTSNLERNDSCCFPSQVEKPSKKVKIDLAVSKIGEQIEKNEKRQEQSSGQKEIVISSVAELPADHKKKLLNLSPPSPKFEKVLEKICKNRKRKVEKWFQEPKRLLKKNEEGAQQGSSYQSQLADVLKPRKTATKTELAGFSSRIASAQRFHSLNSPWEQRNPARFRTPLQATQTQAGSQNVHHISGGGKPKFFTDKRIPSAVLQTKRNLFKRTRLKTINEPSRYGRSRILWKEVNCINNPKKSGNMAKSWDKRPVHEKAFGGRRNPKWSESSEPFDRKPSNKLLNHSRTFGLNPIPNFTNRQPSGNNSKIIRKYGRVKSNLGDNPHTTGGLDYRRGELRRGRGGFKSSRGSFDAKRRSIGVFQNGRAEFNQVRSDSNHRRGVTDCEHRPRNPSRDSLDYLRGDIDRIRGGFSRTRVGWQRGRDARLGRGRDRACDSEHNRDHRSIRGRPRLRGAPHSRRDGKGQSCGRGFDRGSPSTPKNQFRGKNYPSPKWLPSPSSQLPRQRPVGRPLLINSPQGKLRNTKHGLDKGPFPNPMPKPALGPLPPSNVALHPSTVILPSASPHRIPSLPVMIAGHPSPNIIPNIEPARLWPPPLVGVLPCPQQSPIQGIPFSSQQKPLPLIINPLPSKPTSRNLPPVKRETQILPSKEDIPKKEITCDLVRNPEASSDVHLRPIDSLVIESKQTTSKHEEETREMPSEDAQSSSAGNLHESAMVNSSKKQLPKASEDDPFHDQGSSTSQRFSPPRQKDRKPLGIKPPASALSAELSGDQNELQTSARRPLPKITVKSVDQCEKGSKRRKYKRKPPGPPSVPYPKSLKSCVKPSNADGVQPKSTVDGGILKTKIKKTTNTGKAESNGKPCKTEKPTGKVKKVAFKSEPEIILRRNTTADF